MSRAFVSESDSPFDNQEAPEIRSPLPPGAKNYMTPEGAAGLKAELAEKNRQRSAMSAAIAKMAMQNSKAGTADTKSSPQRLRQLERRIDYLTEMLARLDVVDPGRRAPGRVSFGAHVTIQALAGGHEVTYHIVGVDESDPEQGKVSWISPIARSMIGKRVGDEAILALQNNETRMKILKIE